jgi:RimJ/RimL family protein N-acetyltransferase
MLGRKIMLTYRKIEFTDLEIYCKWKSQTEIWEVDEIDEYQSWIPKERKEWFKGVVLGNNCWIIQNDKKPIGYIGYKGINLEKSEAEFIIVIGELAEHSKGYGKESMNWLFNKTFNELKISNLIGYALGNNTKALKFYERIGFKIVGDSEPKYIKNEKEYYLKKIEMKNPN